MKINLYACISGLVVMTVAVGLFVTRKIDSRRNRSDRDRSVPALALSTGGQHEVQASRSTVRSSGGTAAAEGAGSATERSAASPIRYNFVPAEDLHNQLEYFVKRLHADLETEDDFDDAKRKRIRRNADTVAVLAMVLAHHEHPTDSAASAHAVIPAALNLAKHADVFAEARTALGTLDAALNAPTGERVRWGMVGDCGVLMAQVPVLNTSLRRGINGRRFARSRDKSAGLAATIGAIAQVTAEDETFCNDQSERAKWKALSIQMRDAAAACNRAIRQGDQSGAKEAMKRLARSCEDCHELFREDEP